MAHLPHFNKKHQAPMSTDTNSGRERAQKCRSSKKQKKDQALRRLCVLQLVPSTGVVTFVVPKNEVDNTFSTFLENGNIDLLQTSFLEKGETQLFPYNKDDEVPDINFPSVHILVGYLSFKKLMQENFTSGDMSSIWNYTAMDTFIHCMESSPEVLGEWLEEKGVNLIVLGPVVNQTQDKRMSLFNYLGILVKHNIRVYPPLSIVWFLNRKMCRDCCFSNLKLPQAWVRISGNCSWSDIVHLAMEQNIHCANGKKCVVKENFGASATGVYILEEDDKQVWVVKNDGQVPTQNTLVSVEPFSDTLASNEQRLLFIFTSATQTKPLLYVNTRVHMEGTNCGMYASDPVRQTLDGSPKDKTSFHEFRKRAAVALQGSKPSSTMALTNLIFHLDCFKGENDEFILNELDVFPSCYSFIDSYVAAKNEVHDLAGCVVDYIVKHWLEGWQL